MTAAAPPAAGGPAAVLTGALAAVRGTLTGAAGTAAAAAAAVTLTVQLPARCHRLLDEAEDVLATSRRVLAQVDATLPEVLPRLSDDVLPVLAGLAQTQHDVTVVRAGLESLLSRVDLVAQELVALPGAARLARVRGALARRAQAADHEVDDDALVRDAE